MKRHKIFSAMLILLLVIPINKSCKHVDKVSDNVMEYSLTKLGDTFFSLVANSPVKEDLKKKYDAFVARSVNGEVDQKQIEYVAANMLNASNSQEEIKPQLAANIVETTQPAADNPSSVIAREADQDAELIEAKMKTLGDKLSRILAFNDRVRQSYSAKDLGGKIFYRFEDSIQINIDEELKSVLEGTKQANDILEEFQMNQDLTWVKNLSENLRLEQIKFTEKMKSLEKMENLKNLKEFENLQFTLKNFYQDGKYNQFYFNDTSFVMPYIPHVKVDSIMKSIEKTLKDAGI